ncbi:MAG: DUF5130 family protein [Nocardioidaceae bacterium]
MPAGEAFTPDQRRGIERAIRVVQESTGYAFSVYVGAAEGDSRRVAEDLHNQLAEPAYSVLVMVDPAARALEIVTGSQVRRDLDDGEVALAALSMQAAFAAGDLSGGIISGVYQLGEHARRPTSLHTDHHP